MDISLTERLRGLPTLPVVMHQRTAQQQPVSHAHGELPRPGRAPRGPRRAALAELIAHVELDEHGVRFGRHRPVGEDPRVGAHLGDFRAVARQYLPRDCGEIKEAARLEQIEKVERDCTCSIASMSCRLSTLSTSGRVS